MNEIFSVFLNKDSEIPIYQQLGDALLEFIEKGVLKPDSKLPPIRKMASMLKINNDTVVNAYKYLENKKVVYSQVGSGTYVSPLPVSESPKPVIEENIPIYGIQYKFDLKNAINFAGTSTNEDLFPIEDFKKVFNEVLDRDGGRAFSYQESLGYEPLRESICDYLSLFRIKTNASHVQIISGAQQGIDIISKVMLKYGDVLFVEKPTFYGAIGAFLSRGSQIIEIPLLDDGINIDMLENYTKLYSPRFIYIMTYFQTPSGISYSLEKKRLLLELCEKYDTYIIEEDNLSDFNYLQKEIVPLKALDYKNRVIYIKSFSKILMPGLRLGFMILPKKIMGNVITAKTITDISTSGFLQRAFDLYIRSGLWDKHRQNMLSYYKKKYMITVNAVEEHLKGLVTYDLPEGGLSLWIRLNSQLDITKICNDLLKKNVIISPGSLYFANEEYAPFIRLSFANVLDNEINKGVAEIRKAILEQAE